MLELLIELMQGVIEATIKAFNNPYTTIADLVFHADTYIATTLSAAELTKFTKYILNIGYSLILIKALMRGFNQYLLMQEGDADASPFALFGRFIKAIVIAISFPQIYEWGTEIAEDIIEKGLEIMVGFQDSGFIETLEKVILTSGFFSLLMVVVFLVMYLLLYFQFIRRGLEMLILKIGLPWACVGIIDSDEEIFRVYIKKFIHSFITVFVQLLLMKLGLALMGQLQYIWAVATMGASLGTPKLIQEFMIVIKGEGGALNKAYYAGNMGRGLISMIKPRKTPLT